jgi:putative membrane protein
MSEPWRANSVTADGGGVRDPLVGVAPAPPPPETEEPWHRLDPRMIIVRPLNEILGLVPVFLGILVIGGVDIQRMSWGLAVIGVIMVRGVWVWATTKYRITGEQVELHSGLLVRKRLATQRDRIRTVESTAKLWHRVFGLTALRIGTGQQEKADSSGQLHLDAVTADRATELHDLLLDRRVRTSSTVDTVDTPRREELLSELSASWLRYAPLTLSGLVAVGAAAGATWQVLNELHIRPDSVGALRSLSRWVAESAVVTLAVTAVGVVFLAVTAGSVLMYLLRYWNYRLVRQDDGTIRVSRGLLTSTSVTLEERKLRGVEVSEPLLLRAARGARVSAISTGLRRNEDSHLLMPPGPAVAAAHVVAAVLDEPTPPTATPLRLHPPAARRRRLVRSAGVVAVLAATLGVAAALGALPTWPWVVAVCLLPLAAALGHDRYRNLGHALTSRFLVTRSGSLVRDTVALQSTGIIGWKISRTVFQRRSGLITVAATTAAGSGAYLIVDIGESDGIALADATIPGLLAPFITRD